MSTNTTDQITFIVALVPGLVALGAAIYRIVTFIRKLGKEGADSGDLVVIFVYLGLAALLLFVSFHGASAWLKRA